MSIQLPKVSDDPIGFPAIEKALSTPNGLLAFGGDLSPKRLLLAYSSGIFPWYNQGEPILWWAPFPRAVMDPARFLPSKSLKKFQRQHQYQITVNTATHQVIEGCANARKENETWLSPEMQKAYQKLAQLGHCHSVEVWSNKQLIGGLYGVCIGAIFCGESMYSVQPNASKVALWYFCQHFSSCGGTLIDCQVMNDHLKSLGAQTMDRQHFTQHLKHTKTPKSSVEPLARHCFYPQKITLTQ